MNYHLIIKEERRKAPRPLAQVWNWRKQVPDGVDAQGRAKFISVAQPTQLQVLPEHVERLDDMSNIAYAAQWDGVSPYVEVLKGDIADIGLAYAGWPMVTKEQWEAEHPEANP